MSRSLCSREKFHCHPPALSPALVLRKRRLSADGPREAEVGKGSTCSSPPVWVLFYPRKALNSELLYQHSPGQTLPNPVPPQELTHTHRVGGQAQSHSLWPGRRQAAGVSRRRSVGVSSCRTEHARPSRLLKEGWGRFIGSSLCVVFTDSSQPWDWEACWCRGRARSQ